jgi:hypothetical protein
MDSGNVPLNTGSNMSNRNIYGTTYVYTKHEQAPNKDPMANENFNDETFHDLQSIYEDRDQVSDEYYDDNKPSQAREKLKYKKQKQQTRYQDGLDSGADEDATVARDALLKKQKFRNLKKADASAHRAHSPIQYDKHSNPSPKKQTKTSNQSPPSKKNPNLIQSNPQETEIFSFNNYYEKQAAFKFGYSPGRTAISHLV